MLGVLTYWNVVVTETAWQTEKKKISNIGNVSKCKSPNNHSTRNHVVIIKFATVYQKTLCNDRIFTSLLTFIRQIIVSRTGLIYSTTLKAIITGHVTNVQSASIMLPCFLLLLNFKNYDTIYTYMKSFRNKLQSIVWCQPILCSFCRCEAIIPTR